MLRPSGVSSCHEERKAASPTSLSECPSNGRNSIACLFPTVMVPVLSRRMTSASPAVSIALPDFATIFLA